MTAPILMTQTKVIKDADGPPKIGGTVARKRFVWRGPAGDPVFVLQDSRDAVFDHIDIVLETPCETPVLLERTKRGAGVIPNTNHQCRDVRIYGNRLAPYGIWNRATIDENGEHTLLDSVSIYGCTEAGFRSDGQQAKEHRINGLRVEGARVGVMAASSFTMIGGTVSGAQVGVELTRVGDPVTIIGTGFETCGRLLVTPFSTASQSVTLDTVRFEADQLYEDGEAIVLGHAGALLVRGGRLGGGKQRVPRIALRGTGEQVVDLDGVTFGAYGAHLVSPVLAQNLGEARVTERACVWQRDSGDPTNTQTRYATDVPLVEQIRR